MTFVKKQPKSIGNDHDVFKRVQTHKHFHALDLKCTIHPYDAHIAMTSAASYFQMNRGGGVW